MSIYRHIDKLRLVPRLLVGGYAWLMVNISNWFMSLPDPTGSQSAFVSVMVGASAAVFGLYVNSGGKHEPSA